MHWCFIHVQCIILVFFYVQYYMFYFCLSYVQCAVHLFIIFVICLSYAKYLIVDSRALNIIIRSERSDLVERIKIVTWSEWTDLLNLELFYTRSLILYYIRYYQVIGGANPVIWSINIKLLVEQILWSGVLISSYWWSRSRDLEF